MQCFFKLLKDRENQEKFGTLSAVFSFKSPSGGT